MFERSFQSSVQKRIAFCRQCLPSVLPLPAQGSNPPWSPPSSSSAASRARRASSTAREAPGPRLGGTGSQPAGHRANSINCAPAGQPPPPETPVLCRDIICQIFRMKLHGSSNYHARSHSFYSEHDDVLGTLQH